MTTDMRRPGSAQVVGQNRVRKDDSPSIPYAYGKLPTQRRMATISDQRGFEEGRIRVRTMAQDRATPKEGQKKSNSRVPYEQSSYSCHFCDASDSEVTMYLYSSGYRGRKYRICEGCCWQIAEEGGF